MFIGGGNCLVRLQPYSRTTEADYRRHPDFIRGRIKAAKEQLKSLEQWLDTIDAEG